MASSVFALIVGIDQYKSSKIWNLASCVDDALKMKRWLMNDLDVPRDHICMLLDSKATKGAIEDAFMSHLVNNPSIQTGDSIIIYFAGHGSSAVAPDGWQNGRPLHVDILCPYDHGTRVRGNRVPGLTDWSMQAMIHELSEAKGDNITLMLDCSFSPVRSRSGTGTRINTHDLYAGLWRGAGRKVSLSGHGFYQETAGSHVTILACNQGEGAAEDKEGGRFTMAFPEGEGYQLLGDLAIHGGEQHPVCVGKNKDRILFHGTPFKPDNCYVPALFVDNEVRIAAGAIHGVVESTEFSLHKHNVSSVHSTWCLAKVKSQSSSSITEGWVRVTRWNNRTPFKVHLKKTCLSLQRWWKLRRKLPEEPQREATPGGCSVVRVSKAKQAHISVQNHPDGLSIQRHDSLISDNCPQIVQVDTRHALDDVKAIDAAANFHLHLHRKNSKAPLCKKLDGESWSPVEENLLEDGKAMLTLDDSTLYAVSLENGSDVDLWPYLFWMDATGYAIRPVFLPDPAAAPPLKKGGQLTIGTGNIGSEALAFTLNDGEPYNSWVPEALPLDCGSPTSVPQPIEPLPPPSMSPSPSRAPAGAEKLEMPSKELWDAMMACVTIVRGGVKSV
ncbi:hypothetical protein H4582DRAFT_2110095 [Lactarius indigo]|nr:hypothetical protein H4582DRAFT_2110095 [Lactarius indigo]